MNKIKVLIVSLFPEKRYGGSARVALELVEKLHFNPMVEIGFFSPGEETTLKKRDDLTTISIQSKGDNFWLFPNLSQKTIQKVYSFLDQFNPDVIHAHTTGYVALLSQIWAKKNQKPFILTCHEFPSNAFEFTSSSYITRKTLGQFYKHANLDFFKNCDSIIALTPSIQEDLIEKIKYKGKIFRIPNGRDLKQFNNCAIPSLKVDKKQLVFVGNNSYRKNQMFLLKVMKYLPNNYELTLVGSNNDKEYSEKLQSFANINNINVNFIEHVPNKELPSILEKKHLFISASKAEVFSLSLLESLASGTPSIILDEKSTRSWVPKEVVILSKKTTASEFAENIIDFFNQSDKDYAELCKLTRKSVEDYSIDKILDMTINCYKETIDLKIISDLRKENQSKRKLKITNKTFLVLIITMLISLLGFSTLSIREKMKTNKVR